jgi:protein ImuA
MIEELRQRLQALQRPPGIDDDPGLLPLGVEAIDGALGGGLARGALHEIAACGEAHVASAAGFVLGLAALPSPSPGLRNAVIPGREQSERTRNPETASEFATGFRVRGLTAAPRNNAERAGRGELVWVAEDMTQTESGAPYGPALETFGLRPERLVTVQAARTRDLLWALEEALRCRAVATVIGEMRDGEIGSVAVRRLSLAAAESGALALLLRAAPPTDASTAATRWIVGASPSPGGNGVAYAVSLTRNRRGPTGSWILQWSDIDERFLLATHAQPVAAPLLDRPHRQVA